MFAFIFYLFYIIFFFFYSCSCCFFAKSSSRRAAAKAKLTAARCQAKLEHMAATEPTDFHAYVPLRLILALHSGLRVMVSSFYFFFLSFHMLPTGKEQNRSQKRVLCPDTDVRIWIHAGFSVKSATSVTPSLLCL